MSRKAEKRLRVTCLGLLSADKSLIRLPDRQSIDISNKLVNILQRFEPERKFGTETR